MLFFLGCTQERPSDIGSLHANQKRVTQTVVFFFFQECVLFFFQAIGFYNEPGNLVDFRNLRLF